MLIARAADIPRKSREKHCKTRGVARELTGLATPSENLSMTDMASSLHTQPSLPARLRDPGDTKRHLLEEMRTFFHAWVFDSIWPT
jgi:hypothetical protein